MNREEQQKLAVEYNHCSNCCQSVLLAYQDQLGMDEDTLRAMGTCFARGMFNGEVCGAVTGGLMALGLLMPGTAARAGKELQSRFRQELGSTICREVLKAHGGQICDTCVACTAGIVYDLMDETRKEES